MVKLGEYGFLKRLFQTEKPLGGSQEPVQFERPVNSLHAAAFINLPPESIIRDAEWDAVIRGSSSFCFLMKNSVYTSLTDGFELGTKQRERRRSRYSRKAHK